MAGNTQLPYFIQLRFEERSAFNELRDGVRNTAREMQREFGTAFNEIERQISDTLSRPRTQTGSLDFGVEEMRQAAIAQDARATAAREAAIAIRAAAEAEQDYSQQARQTVAAAEALAVEEERLARSALSRLTAGEQIQAQLNKQASATELVVSTSRRAAGATGNLADEQRNLRTASLQAGQQLQDIAISLYSGQRAGVVFAQQLPQLAFALSSLEGSTNSVHARIGRFATFLSGPWGLAVGLGVGALGALIYNLIAAGDAADEASDKSSDHAAALDFQRMSTEELTNAIFDNLEAQRQSIALSYQSAAAARTVAAENLNEAITEREKTKALLEGYQVSQRVNAGQGTGGVAGAGGGLLASAAEADVAAQNANIVALRESLRLAQVPLSRRQAAAATDEAAAATLRYEQAEAALTEQFRKGDIAQAEYDRRLTQIYRDRKAAEDAARSSDRSSRTGRRNTGADRAAREYEPLTSFGEQAGEAIARLNERFGDQPRLITQAARATRELDAIIGELETRQPPGFEGLIENAEQAKQVVEDALLRPTRELREESERRLEIDALIAQGREDEAEIVSALYALENELGTEQELRAHVQDLINQGRDEEARIFQRLIDLYPRLRSEVRDTISYEQERTRELERQRDLFEAQIDVIDEAKASLRDLLSGRDTDFLGNIKGAIDDLRGARLFDDMFGDVFQQLEDEIRGKSPLGEASERYARELDDGRPAIGRMASAAEIYADRMLAASAPFAAANDNIVPGAAANYGDAGGEIVVTAPAREEPQELGQLTIAELSDRTAAAIVGPMLEGLDEALGTEFMQSMSGALTGALSGYLQAGRVGGVLGAGQGFLEQHGESLFGHTNAESYAKIFGSALGGARTGSQTDAILDLLGLKSSGTGAAIGGALGTVVGGPVGSIIGSIAGGLIGGIFGGGNRTANAVVTQDGYTVGGKDDDNYGTADSLGSAVSNAIEQIADELGASIGDYFVSIGVRGDQYRVNTDGSSLKFDNGAVGFGQDQEAAVRYAILDAITDGALKGISDAELRLLKAGKDLDQALQDVLSFRSVFDRLAQYKDPVGYALDQLDAEFERLIDLFDTAGASAEEYAQLEELYGIERAKAIEEATERASDALKRLLDDLTIGDSGLSLRTRQQNAIAAYDPLAERVAAGDTTAYDDYADAARALLEIEREMYGSTQDYFDRLAEVTSLTQSRVSGDANVTPLYEDRASPFDSAGKVKDAVDSQTTAVVSQLQAINDNLIAIGRSDSAWARARARAQSNISGVANF